MIRENRNEHLDSGRQPVSALRYCLEVNVHLPSYAVVVDTLDEGVQGFYEQYGFHELDRHNGHIRLYLPMKTVAELFS